MAKGYRICPYCQRYIPTEYSFAEHKKLCKNVHPLVRGDKRFCAIQGVQECGQSCTRLMEFGCRKGLTDPKGARKT